MTNDTQAPELVTIAFGEFEDIVAEGHQDGGAKYTLSTVAAAQTAAVARAALEQAAIMAERGIMSMDGGQAAVEIRTIPIPADASAALDALIAERVREAYEDAAKIAEAQHKAWNALGNKCLVDDDVSACADIANAIRARAAERGK